MKKRKKVWIVLLSVVFGLFVLIAGTYFTTKLRTVNIEFRTRLGEAETRLPSGILDTVKDSAEFNYKDSVLFMDVESSISKIEKSNPYVKVTDVRRKFPNKLTVYISERIPKFRIVDGDDLDSWIILDEDFKVLEKITNAELLNQELDEKTVEIKYFSEKIEVGEFLPMGVERDNLNAILTGVYGRTKDYFAVRSIDYSSDTNTFYITMRMSVEKEDGTIEYQGGCVIEIEGDNDLSERSLEATCFYVGDYKDKMADISLTEKVTIISNKYGTFFKQ